MKKSTSSRKSPASSLQKAHAKTLASVESHPRSSRSRRLTPPLPELDEPVALAVVHTPTTPNQNKKIFTYNRIAKFCAICKKDNHSTETCFRNKKSTNFVPKKQQQQKSYHNKKVSQKARPAKKWHPNIKRINIAPPTNTFQLNQKALGSPMHVKIVTGLSGSKAIMIPLLVNGKRISALADTGCNVSCISDTLAQRLNLKLRPETIKLTGATGIPIPTIATTVVSIQGNKKQFEETLVVCQDSSEELILSLDALAKLGIHLTNLPTTYDDDSLEERSEDLDSLVINDEKISASDHVDDKIKVLLNSGISQALQRNKELPQGTLSNQKEFEIKLSTDRPFFVSQYPLSKEQSEAVSKRIKEWLELGYIEEVSSFARYNQPLWAVVKKKDGIPVDYRVCMDFRVCNSFTVEDPFMIPNIKEIYARISGFKIASVLDLKDSFLQIGMSQSSREFTTFRWKNHAYQWTRMFFGALGATNHMQKVVLNVLKDCLDFVQIYVDDICIFSMEIEQHIQHVAKVLDALTKGKLKINSSKCIFGVSKLRLLGHIVTGETISIDPRKLEILNRLPLPDSPKKMQRFLGFTNYLREYLPRYSEIVADLYEYASLKKKAELSLKQKEDFKKITKMLMNSLTLSQPDFNKEFHVATDASIQAIGAVLFQVEDDGKKKYLSFLSQKLVKYQRNYAVWKKELLAIITAVKKWREYLVGRRFHIYTDHQALVYLLGRDHDAVILGGWKDLLLDFSFEVHHLPGLENVIPDYLSRIIDENSTKYESKLPTGDGYIYNIRSVEEMVTSPGKQLRQFIEQRFDKVAPSPEECQKLIELKHQTTHLGADLLFRHLWLDGYYWTSMFKECKQAVLDCTKCMRFNIQKTGFHPKREITSLQPGDMIAFDLLILPNTIRDTCRYVVVIVDICSRFVWLKSIKNKTRELLAETLLEYICTFGPPRFIQSDAAPENISAIELMVQLFNTKRRTICPYTPSQNGTPERFVQEVKQKINKLLINNSSWVAALPHVQLLINSTINTRHNSPPFSVMFMRNINPSKDYLSDKVDKLEDLNMEKRLKESMEIWEALDSSVKMKINKRKSTKKLDILSPGELVMKQVDIRKHANHARNEGPFKVVSQSGGGYELSDLHGNTYPHLVPREKLRKFHSEESFHDRYSVEKILNHRDSPEGLEFLIKWENHKETTWEPESNLDGCEEILADYLKRSRKRKRE